LLHQEPGRFQIEAACFIQKRREFFSRGLTFLGADSNIETTITRSIRSPLAIDVESNDAPAVIQRDSINKWHECRLDFLTTDAH
jgi:hypothetical protein